MKINNDYDGLFAVSKLKRKTRLSDGKILTKGVVEENEFDLHNHNIYNEEGKLLETADQKTYNSEFLIQISLMYVLDIPDFLDHHYTHTSNKEKYLTYLEFGIIPDNHISEGRKGAIKQWVDKKYKAINWKIDSSNPLENFDKLCSDLHLYFADVFKTKHVKLQELGEELHGAKGKKITVTAAKSKIEIEALYLTKASRNEVIRIVKNKFQKVIDQEHKLIKMFKMTHIDNMRLYKHFFTTVQEPLWGFWDWFRDLIGEIDLSKPPKEQPKKLAKKETSLSEFFVEKVSGEQIEAIQNAFHNTKGRALAIVVYLLQSDFKVINIINASKTESRAHFCRALTKNPNIIMRSVNKTFDPNKNTLKILSNDPQLIGIKEKLGGILK